MSASLAASSPWYISEWEMMLRLLMAVLLGGLVGFEREQSNHAAGLRTNILVCLGSCLLMLLSAYGFSAFINETNVRLDPARLAAQVITGIGFLGAGTILFTGKSITGLTTAATLWVVSAIGLAVGAGFLFPAVAVTVIVLIVLIVLNKVERKFSNGKKEHHLQILADETNALLQAISALLQQQGIVMRKMSLQEHGDREMEGPRVMLLLYVNFPRSCNMIKLLEEIKSLDGVHAVSAE
ncbi:MULTISPECIES: MgtC/SapB family protein [unclassified Paenibacillus]|uniref:MgtC/SapB family protein n=1 Tax=unclassified Paenibacillus TaxID=185978 RepID=UPI0009542145|nr:MULTISPECIES: MgtC/SapB family protein [unclassified Paenibacillus]ASS69473.1 MgtC/SapB family protein [Paenibacillus sp. RUD330]SIR57993.1 putative Mg2+ transporter-C (MgtC) family protein [Paenibacillus sp. RU4X]SIR66725.1 putative Mg2+ transporter-C (MgtC) family protein [Paenibacillus sp. RU4T]